MKDYGKILREKKKQAKKEVNMRTELKIQVIALYHIPQVKKRNLKLIV